MAIKFDATPTEDGFFSFFGDAQAFHGDKYLVKTPEGTVVETTAEWEEYVSFNDADGNDTEAEWIKPLGPEDRIDLHITATRDDIPKLLEGLRALSSVNTTANRDPSGIEENQGTPE